MKKLNFPKTDLACVMQIAEVINPNECHTGLLTQNEDGTFRFEEAIRKGRPPRNQKLYDGQYISMVRMQNGKYQMHMKTLGSGFDKEKLPFAIYSEVTAALQILD